MRNLFLIAFLMLSFTIFSQKKKTVEDYKVLPTSIFAFNSLNYQQNEYKVSDLYLDGHKFLIADFFNNNLSFSNTGRINLELRNFGRHASYEDITDNYNKAQLNKYDVSKNTDHFIWNAWNAICIQRQWQENQ